MAGLQFLLLGGMAKAQVKGVFVCHRHRYEAYEELTKLAETRLAQNSLNHIKIALNTLKIKLC